MKCPNCGIEAPAGALDCAGCGAIFAKLLAQREREKKEAAEFLAAMQSSPPTSPKYWPNRTVAIIVVLVWFGALFWYYVNTLNAGDERIQADLRARSRAAAMRVSPSPP